nr:nucleoprotein [Himastelon rhabdovirus 1]
MASPNDINNSARHASRIVFKDSAMQKTEEIILQVAGDNTVAEYYPINKPDKKVDFPYALDKNWTIPTVRELIKNSLAAGILPPEECQVYFLVEFVKSIKVKLDKPWHLGSLPELNAGAELNIQAIVNFVPSEQSFPDVSLRGSDESDKCDYGYAAWLLVQSRLGRFEHLDNYVKNLLTRLKNLTMGSPFNLRSAQVENYPSSVSNFLETVHSKSIKHLAAYVDYLAVLSKDDKLKKLRFSTMTTRFEDHSGARLFATIGEVFFSDMAYFLQLIVVRNVAYDLMRILKPGQGLEKIDSFTPYSRSLDLITRSKYSSVENPYFCTFASVYLSIVSKPSYLNAFKPVQAVDAAITLAIKIASKTGAADTFDSFFEQVESKTRTLGDTPLPTPSTIPDAATLAATIKEEIISQGGRPTRKEKELLIGLAKSIEPRSGTIGEYVTRMECFEDQREKIMIAQSYLPNTGTTVDVYGQEDDVCTVGKRSPVAED